jgi:hypothetical protein
MKRFFPILALVCLAWSCAFGQGQNESAPASPAAGANSSSQIPLDQENARKARAIIDQAIGALGGQNYLTIRDREQQGRTYSMHHGQQTSNGVLFWSFSEFPDKERVELTKERDVAELYVGNKGYEVTYKGAHPVEEKDLTDYMRRRRYSLDIVLRSWVKDPSVVLLYEGAATAAQHPAQQVTLINAKDESVTLYFDTDTHLPVKKSFTWRDPVDRQKNLEEEVYENYRQVSGVMAPYNVTRYFNGDMAGERFMFNVTINQGLNQAMFDPNSRYDPNKQPGKH